MCVRKYEGWLYLFIYLRLSPYLSPRLLSSTIYQSVLVLYLLSGSSISKCHRLLRTSSLAGLGEGVEQTPCLSRTPLVPSTTSCVEKELIAVSKTTLQLAGSSEVARDSEDRVARC